MYAVEDTNGSLFALKKVSLDELDPMMVEHHLNEIKLLTQFKGNPYIIQLYEWYLILFVLFIYLFVHNFLEFNFVDFLVLTLKKNAVSQ